MVHRAANFFIKKFLTADSADFISIFVERRMIPFGYRLKGYISPVAFSLGKNAMKFRCLAMFNTGVHRVFTSRVLTL